MSIADGGTSYMPKSHGRIVPWVPPRFGIPDEVMRRLADVLEKEAVHHACVKDERANMSVNWTRSGLLSQTRETLGVSAIAGQLY